MKLSQSASLILATISSASAFAPSFVPRVLVSTPSRQFMAEEGSDMADVVSESAMPSADPYDRIGISKEEMALGIDATEFLQWIGTKGELMEKFQRDNKGMSEERADEEVSKFMMDSEMVNAYIKFERNKIENPPDRKAEAEQTLSDPKTIATYVAWIIGGAGFGYVRKSIIEPKYASGEWEEIHIPLPALPGMGEKAAEAVSSTFTSVDGVSLADMGHHSIDALSTLA